MTYVILGNGVAGINAATTIRAKAPGARIVVVSDETRMYYSRTALMYIAMGDMRLKDTQPLEARDFKRMRIERYYDTATSLDTANKKVILANNSPIAYDKLCVATGSIAAMHGWKGSGLDGVVNFVLYQDLENLMRLIPQTRKAVVVGGGLIGIELVEVLRHFGIEVTFLIRGETFWNKALSEDEGRLVQRHMQNEHGVNVITGDSLDTIYGSNGCVAGITTTQGRDLACRTVAVATGVRPNIEMVSRSGIPCRKGVLVNDRLQTHVPDVYAAGDCVEIEKSMEAHNFVMSIWYLARDMGRVAGSNMCGDSVVYEPGMWYNSAKFFDFEYTSAGKFLPDSEDENDFFYADSQGRRSVRIVYREQRVIGFSMIGARWNHEVLHEFIHNRHTLTYVLDNLSKAWFEPEFHSFERSFGDLRTVHAP